MDWSNIPEWLKLLGSAAIGALGMFGVAIIRAVSDNKRIRSDDRIQFTSQILDRVASLESQVLAERKFCREEIRRITEQADARLASRDQIIKELRARVAHLERLLAEGPGLDHSSNPRV